MIRAAMRKATLSGVGNYTLQAIMIDNGEPGSKDQWGRAAAVLL